MRWRWEFSQYHDPSLRLTFPDKDAADFVAAIQTQKGPLYQDVQIYNGKALTDTDATKDAIEDGLQWLQEQAASPNDVAIIYLSGHGYDDPSGNYYFLPCGFDRQRYKKTGLPGTDIFDTIRAIKAKVIFFDDSCYAGNALGGVDTTGFINALSEAKNGAVVFAAATGDEEALEDPKWQNGAFTRAVVEAMDGAAQYDHTRDYDSSGVVDYNMLASYTYDRVKQLTDDRQHPAGVKPTTMLDFAIAQTRSN